MNPTRPINLDTGLRPTAPTPTVTLTGERRSPLPRLEPDVARVRPLDRDAALRILIEEVKSALIERFGDSPVAVPATRAGPGSSNMLGDLARLLQSLLSNLTAEGEELPAPMLELAEEAVIDGGRRALDTLSHLPLIDASVIETVEQMRWLLVRMVAVQADALRNPGDPLKGRREPVRARRRPGDPEVSDTPDTRLPFEVERDEEEGANG
jgi:hypothetical protein